MKLTFVYLMISLYLSIIYVAKLCIALPRNVHIAGIFADDELEQFLVFHAAIEKINLAFSQTSFTAVHQIVPKENAFLGNIKTCSLIWEKSPVVIFGPLDEITSMQVQSICEHLEIPHIQAQLALDMRQRSDLTVNLHPHLSTLSRAHLTLIDEWSWKTFAIVYEDSQRIIHFGELFQKASRRQYNYRLYQLQEDVPYREILWKLKESGITNVLLDVRTEHIEAVLRQALQVGLLTERHHYLITSLDLHTLNLANYRHSRVNLTSLRMVKEDHPWLSSLLQDWQEYNARYVLPTFHTTLPKPRHLKSQSAMIYDSVHILAQALEELNGFTTPEVSCASGKAWPFGTSLINYTRHSKLHGITGYVFFGNTGIRTQQSFDILSTTEETFEVIATWKEESGRLLKNDNWTKHFSTSERYDLIRVTTVLNDPFVMNTKSSKALKGNARYEGYVVDLMTEVGTLLNFRFEINIVKDKQYGSMINVEKSEWNGMIGEVMRGEADIAVADLTINSHRQLAVDFSYPFMSTGISIIYKPPKIKETSFWSFLSPFSPTVWIYLLTAVAGISLVLFYIGRFTPYEWANPNPCPHHKKVLENACSMRNSFWCSIGSLMQQGSDVMPRALSTRIISAMWYFFTLIIVSSYTANLAAFLTVENVRLPFENVEELSAQNKITYGCMANGSTHKFFANSNIPTYRKMAQFMEANPEWLMPSNAAGRKMVDSENGRFAFFMESAPIEFITERDCNLTQIGGLLDHKGYGVALKKGSKLRSPLSETILKLQETGVLQRLKDRWWKQKGGGQCIAKPPPALIKLSLQNLGGVFVVLVVGTLFAILIGVCEFLLNVKLTAAENKTLYKRQLWDELKFALSTWKLTKIQKQKKGQSVSESEVLEKTLPQFEAKEKNVDSGNRHFSMLPKKWPNYESQLF